MQFSRPVERRGSRTVSRGVERQRGPMETSEGARYPCVRAEASDKQPHLSRADLPCRPFSFPPFPRPVPRPAGSASTVYSIPSPTTRRRPSVPPSKSRNVPCEPKCFTPVESIVPRTKRDPTWEWPERDDGKPSTVKTSRPDSRESFSNRFESTDSFLPRSKTSTSVTRCERLSTRRELTRNFPREKISQRRRTPEEQFWKSNCSVLGKSRSELNKRQESFRTRRKSRLERLPLVRYSDV